MSAAPAPDPDSQPIISGHGKLREYTFATGHYMDIPLDLLDADPLYQRDANAKAIREIITQFTLDSFEAPTVNPRKGGRFAVIDGQNRVEAARELSMKYITCRVVKKDAPKAEAEVFVTLNRSRRWLTPVQTFKAESAYQPAAREIIRCLEERGLHIGNAHAPNVIGAAVAIKKIYNARGYPRLSDVLNILMGTWPDDEPRRFAGLVLAGMNAFLDNNPNADRARLEERLSRLTARRLIALANNRWHAWRGLEEQGGSLIEAMADEIKKQYLKR